MKEQAYLNELMDRYPILQPVRESIAEAYKVLRECFESGHKLLVAGNGGSAADSEHMVGELMKGFVKQRLMSEDMAKKLEAVDLEAGKELSSKLQGGLPTIALTGHPGLSTAFLMMLMGLWSMPSRSMDMEKRVMCCWGFPPLAMQQISIMPL